MKRKQTISILITAGVVFLGLSCSERSNPINSVNNTIISSSSESSTDIVSTDWLLSNLDNKSYTIIDVRSAVEYSNGNIPNSINIPFDIISTWAQTDFSPNGLWLELPEITNFISQLGENGISLTSKVVLVTGLPTENNPFSLAAPTRVALTLAYAGLKKIYILDGGFDTWASEGKPVVTEATVPTATIFKFKDVADLFVDIDFVYKKLGKIILVDARDAAVYAGDVLEPWTSKPGHIPTALSLPAPSLWNSDGTYKTKTEIQAIADAVIGNPKDEDIVIYCGVGGYASTVWYALTTILNYSNVKVFDGSAQEWAMYYDMEM